MPGRPAARPRTPAVPPPAPPRRNRISTVLVTAAVAVALLAAPQLTAPASAATPHTAATARTWAHNMVIVINRERRANGRAALRMNSRLALAAHRHNLAMAKRNSMSHQLPGEAFFATRISRAGYKWMDAGENIGFTTTQTNLGLQTMQHRMYHERAPYNGHRLNILSRSFREVGVDVYFDKAHHKMWFTQDFGRR